MANSCRNEKLWFLDTLIEVHVPGAASADGMSVIEHRAPHGSSPPMHVHHGEDEIFYMVSGEARFVVDGAEIHLRGGGALLAPKGKPHSFRVTSPAGARWLTLTSGGDFERMVRRMGRPAARDELPPQERPSPEQISRLAAACRDNRIELVGPPLD